MKSPRAEYILLLIAAFLAPIIGGQVPVDAQPLSGSLLSELLGGPALPLGSRLILSALLLSALAVSYWKNRVVQLPNLRIAFVFGLLTIFLVSSIFVTDFKYPAVRELLAWITYFGAFAAAIAVAGRKTRVIGIMTAIGAGCSFVAIRGIWEYLSVFSEEPTYRIFAGWNNPNAVASVFIFGAFLLTGVFANTKGFTKGIVVSGIALNIIALLLTQSKGGILALVIGIVAFLVFHLSAKTPARAWFPGFCAVLIGLIVGLGLIMGATKLASSSNGALSRISGASSQVEQSAGFRKNLWLSAVDLSVRNPVGTGIGTYRFYSAQPGRTDSTVFAHQSYLQLAAESGWAALVALVSLAILWLNFLFKGSRLQPTSIQLTKGSIFAACVGFGAHGMVESNLSFFGAGLLFFLVLGLGLQSSTDGTAPEATPIRFRTAAIVGMTLIPLLAHVIFAAIEAKKAAFMTAVATGNVSSVREQAQGLLNNYGDPESQYLVAYYATPELPERVSALSRVAEKFPLPRVFRALASLQHESGDSDLALQTLKRVHKYDPVNLKARHQALNILIEENRIEEAIVVASDLINQESTSSFQIRAIPEAVPTETYEARLFLAKHAQKAEKIRLLEEAIEGFKRYAQQTKPMVERMTSGGLRDFAGETEEDVSRKMDLARKATLELIRLKNSQGASSGSGDTLTEILGLFSAD
ncbi:O-antigen ligase family protein [Kamptonema cortianum]|nr:O-antigen ligase family protein [Geitlerinema splendidum]MDK3158402.1 O-antigen ligase family protein [Kamptonema cortianum]